MTATAAPTLTQSTPVLAVRDVPAAMAFYRDTLGFDWRWDWGEPPTFGCVGLGRYDVFFSHQPELAAQVAGLQHVFFCDDVNTLHAQHTAAGADIVSPIENKPWNVREYTVRDLTGYHLRFAGPADYQRPATATEQLPDHIAIELRKATAGEYTALLDAVGWNRNEPTLASAIEHALFFAIAVDQREGKVVGMLRVCGDGRQYTIWDVMVLPDYQAQRIGTAMVERALARLREIGPKGAFVGLFTLNPAFYDRLGFSRNGAGMHLGL